MVSESRVTWGYFCANFNLELGLMYVTVRHQTINASGLSHGYCP